MVDLLRDSPTPVERLSPLPELDSVSAGKPCEPEMSHTLMDGVPGVAPTESNGHGGGKDNASPNGDVLASEALARHKTISQSFSTGSDEVPASPFAAMQPPA